MSDGRNVVVVDYDAGNLGSVVRALRRCGCAPVLGDNEQAVGSADRLILPGVGAFGSAMRRLNEKNLVQPILEHAKSGKPLLGICLGMQMLASESEEFGLHKGLDLIPGRVVSIPRQDASGARLKVPNIGWCRIAPPDGADKRWDDSVARHWPKGAFVYFVHSYQFLPQQAADVLAYTSYSGVRITAAVSRKNVHGTQFHPEKSGEVGLKILKEFLES